MDLDSLDNPAWHALNSHHRHLSIRGDCAVRYQPDLFSVAAISESNALGLGDLKNLVSVGEVTSLFGGTLPDDITGWEVLNAFRIPQMVGESLQPSDPIEAIELTADDVPEMLALVALAKPGPFLSRTIEMGHYLGVRQKGQLVAMAGQRLHLTGFTEISAVCTHPDYRNRGYAGALTLLQATYILDRQETPFLHMAPTNDVAKRLYLSLGFRQRAELTVSVLRRLN